MENTEGDDYASTSPGEHKRVESDDFLCLSPKE